MPDHEAIHAASSQFVTSCLPKAYITHILHRPLTRPTLWDSCNTVVHAYLSPSGVQKFDYIYQYLKVQMQGDAARTIAGLPLMKLNYQTSVVLLEEWFGQPHKLNVSTHATSISDVEPN